MTNCYDFLMVVRPLLHYHKAPTGPSGSIRKPVPLNSHGFIRVATGIIQTLETMNGYSIFMSSRKKYMSICDLARC